MIGGQETIKQLREERDALAAHVERLSSGFANATTWEDVREVFAVKPSTSLDRLKVQWDAEELQPIWETLIKVADLLNIDPEQARKVPGKPSGVYASALSRLIAEKQAEALNEVLRRSIEAFEADTVRLHIRNVRRSLERQAEEDAP